MCRKDPTCKTRVKTCNKCGKSRSLEEFDASPSCRDGHHGGCRPCKNGERNRKRREMGRGPWKPQTLDEALTCKRCGKHKTIEEFKPNKESQFGILRICRACENKRVNEWRNSTDKGREGKIRNTLRKHGLTLEMFSQMNETQLGKCLICSDEAPAGKRLYVDHDHRCCAGQYSCGNCVRGLICDPCNRGLSAFRDDETRLSRAIEYLQYHRKSN